jgi:hypothetical protein
MTKHLYILLFTLFFASNIFSQEASIATKFAQDGYLFEKLNDYSQPLVQFKENEKCIITAFLGSYTYKVKYKEWTGFVKDQYLFINEEMMDLYFDHEEKQREKAIKERKNRQRKIFQIVNKDSIAKAKEDERKALITQKRNDSIAKVAENKHKALILQKRNDSITKTKEDERKALATQKRNDSIAKVTENKHKAKALILQKRNDSITKAKEDERKALATQKRNDSIAKVAENKRKALILQKRNDSITKTKENERNEFRRTCHYEINEYDEFYKEENIRTIPYELNKKLTVELYKQGRRVNVFFNFSEDLGCVSYLPNNRSYVKVKLENNQTISFYHSWDIDCEGFYFKGRLSSSQIISLKKSPIKSIKLKGTKNFKEITNINYKEFFIDKLSCLE